MITREEVLNSIVEYLSEINGDNTIDENTNIGMFFDDGESFSRVTSFDENPHLSEFIDEVDEMFFVSLNIDDYDANTTIGKFVDDVMEQLS